MGPPSRFDFDWPRISRWCLLGTIVMLLWLLAPVATCSWGAFRDTPMGEIEPPADVTAGQPGEEHAEGPGFLERWGGAMKACYRKTPLLGQEGWKGNLLIGFGALTVIAWALGWNERRRHRTFADRR